MVLVSHAPQYGTRAARGVDGAQVRAGELRALHDSGATDVQERLQGEVVYSGPIPGGLLDAGLVLRREAISAADWDAAKKHYTAKMSDPNDMGRTAMAFMPLRVGVQLVQSPHATTVPSRLSARL